MRILMLNNEFPPIGGGTATANFMLFREWAKMPDLEMDLITGAPGREREERAFSDRIRIIRLPVGITDAHHAGNKELLTYAWKGLQEATARHREKPYDLVMAWHAVPAGLIAKRLHARFRLPYLVRVGGADIPGFEKRFRFLYPFLTPVLKSVWKTSSRLVVKSQGEKAMLQKASAALQPQIIANGVDTDWFAPGPPRPAGARRQILCVARLIERKGQRFLIEALARLVADGLDAELVLVGGGDDRTALEALVSQHQLGDRVIFAGDISREELPAYYQAADVFAMMSFNEGMSNAMLEALSCGLPVVVSRTPGTRETVTDGINGVQLDYGDVDGLTRTLKELLTDSDQRQRMAHAAREGVSRFSWVQAAAHYHQLFHELV